jgi:low affinity Fe/Cu permease
MIRPDESAKPNGANNTPVINHSAAHALHELFRKFSHASSTVVGSPWAFIVASLIVVVWAFLGHHYHYSDTWQLIINTGTTIVTFLMVFLIQNTQNRDARAIHLKLDELIRGHKGARNRLVDLENCTDEELDEMEKEFHRVRRKARQGNAPEQVGREAPRAQETVKAIADSPGRV